MNKVARWITIIGYLTAITFLFVGLLQVYWAAGGTWALAFLEGSTVPVGFASKIIPWLLPFPFFLAMLIVLGKMGLWGKNFPQWIYKWGIWGVIIVLFLDGSGVLDNIGLFTKDISKHLPTWFLQPSGLLILIFCVIIATTFKEG